MSYTRDKDVLMLILIAVCDFGLSQIKPVGENLRDRDSAKGTPLW